MAYSHSMVELKNNCKIENPSRLFWFLAQYVASNKFVLEPHITIVSEFLA